MFKSNKMKGFTLIELLAVIVILAIIALIATPLILNVINDAKKGSFQASSYGIIDAAEYSYSRAMLKGSVITDTVYYYVDSVLQEPGSHKIELNYKGSMPNNGTLIINSDGKIAIAFYQDGWCATKSYSESKITIADTTLEECVVPEVIYNTFNYDKGVNKPQIVAGLTPIKWDEGNNEIETTINDNDWYDYSNKKWANAKTADGSYWVWIPRYAYKMLSGYSTGGTDVSGEFDIVFLKDKTNGNSQGITIEINGYEVGLKDTSMHHFLHPAFNQGGEEILGYWVAKFEPSNTIDEIKMIPNVDSLRSVDVNTIFTSVKNMKTNGMYGWSSSNVDPHMMTNLEWGGVTYLTHSTYGKNAEVWINPYWIISQTKTGCAGASVSASYGTTCNAYTTTNGQQASTTGNITGIYDMSGGAIEYVAAYVNNGNANLTTNALSLLNESNLKYKNVYQMQGTDSDINNYNINNNIYGDAVYETSNSYTGSTSWYGDYSQMPQTISPVVRRGGNYGNTSDAGLFSTNTFTGASSTSSSFRVSFRVLE